MGLYFVGTNDLRAVDMSGLGPRDIVVVFGQGKSAWNDDNLAKLRFVEGAATAVSGGDATGIQSRQFRSGQTQICCSSHPLLTWPGAKDGIIQVFWHEDWPGSFQAVNINPLLWDRPIVSADETFHRGIQLPELPFQLPDAPSAGTRTQCLSCHTGIDLRFCSGHAWYDGNVVLRAGTTEVIVCQTQAQMIDERGPYCAQCIDTAVYTGELQAPTEQRYDGRHNRSFPKDLEVPKHLSALKWSEHPYADACRRYGVETYEWMLGEDPAITRRRVRNAAKLLARFMERGESGLP